MQLLKLNMTLGSKVALLDLSIPNIKYHTTDYPQITDLESAPTK